MRLGCISSVAVVVSMASACGSAATPSSPTANAAAACDPNLWMHVYEPGRLTIVDSCRTVTGTVSDLHTNEDGDVDIRLALDAPFANMVNDANRAQLEGHLQLETVCQSPPTTPESREACGSFVGTVPIPSPGQHVSVTGTYVLDTNHGWMELHPVSVIRVLP